MAKLRFAVRKFAPFEQALADTWSRYQAMYPSDIQMEFVPMDLEELYAALFQKDGLQNGSWDIAHVNTDWITEAYEKGCIQPLDEYIKKQPPEGGIDAWAPSLTKLQQFEGHFYGLPFHDGPECLVLRKDLFNATTEKERFFEQHGRELRAPQTWDEFLDVASFFYRPEQGLYGTVFGGYPDGHNAVFDFCIQLWARGGELTTTSGAVSLVSAAAVDALDFYRRLFREPCGLHPKSLDYESVQAGQAFARGEAAMMVNWFGFASWAHIDEASAVRGQVDIAPIPACDGYAAPSLNVYWLYTVGNGSAHKERAYDFLRFAVQPEQDKQLTLTGGVGCRRTTWTDAEINGRIPFYAKLEQLHETARTLPRLRNWAAIAHIIDQMVNQAIQTNTESNVLLYEAQQKIEELT